VVVLDDVDVPDPPVAATAVAPPAASASAATPAAIARGLVILIGASSLGRWSTDRSRPA
jgi:hypothetical protein